MTGALSITYHHTHWSWCALIARSSRARPAHRALATHIARSSRTRRALVAQRWSGLTTHHSDVFYVWSLRLHTVCVCHRWPLHALLYIVGIGGRSPLPSHTLELVRTLRTRTLAALIARTLRTRRALVARTSRTHRALISLSDECGSFIDQHSPLTSHAHVVDARDGGVG